MCPFWPVADWLDRQNVSHDTSGGSVRNEALIMQEVSFEEAIAKIRAKDARYHQEAYLFVREALDHTQKILGKESGVRAHVTGQELLAGIRDFALSHYGPMAMSLLSEWGIHRCEDFGEIVFNMVEIELLAKTNEDSRADFANGYDFYEAFRRPFLPSASQSPHLPEPKPTKV